jgi:5-methylcytosine-specific restriction endonuclease McrA
LRSSISKWERDKQAARQSDKYKAYMASPEWAALRAKVIEAGGGRCQVCNADGPGIQAHHRTYERLGAELLGDLIAICTPCHTLFHDNRSLAARPRSPKKSKDRVVGPAEKALVKMLADKGITV